MEENHQMTPAAGLPFSTPAKFQLLQKSTRLLWKTRGA
jgi:hypothetical protein